MTNEERAREALSVIEAAREKMDGPVKVGFQWVVYNLDLPPLGTDSPGDNTISHWTFAAHADAIDFMRVRAMTAALNAATAELEDERGRLREVLEDVSLGEVYGKKFMAINNVLGGFWSIELTGEEDIAAATEWDARRRSALAKKEPSNENS